MMKWKAMCGAVLVCLACPALASADIGPPSVETMTCPRGAVPVLPEVDPEARDERGRPLRPWPYCGPSTCASDADCDGGRVCSEDEIGLCVQDHPVHGGEPGRSVRGRGCEPDNTCLNIHSDCEVSRRCVTPEPPVEGATETEATAPDTESGTEPEGASDPEGVSDPGTAPAAVSSGCGCRVAGDVEAPAWLLALLAVFVLRRRR